MLEGYLQNATDKASGWPFYVQMEFLLGQVPDPSAGSSITLRTVDGNGGFPGLPDIFHFCPFGSQSLENSATSQIKAEILFFKNSMGSHMRIVFHRYALLVNNCSNETHTRPFRVHSDNRKDVPRCFPPFEEVPRHDVLRCKFGIFLL